MLKAHFKAGAVLSALTLLLALKAFSLPYKNKNKGDSMPRKTIKLSSYSPAKDASQNAREAFNLALEECRANPHSDLVVEPGVYLISDPAAIKLMKEVMDPLNKANDASTIFTPYFPYVKGLDLGGLNDVRIQAQGATILCEGFMEPVSVIGSTNVCLEGLSISYKRLPFSQGTIVDIKDDCFDVKLDSDTPLTGRTALPRVSYWDPKRQRITPDQAYFLDDNEITKDGLFRIKAEIPKDRVGFTVMLNHSLHFRPGIFLNESQDVFIKDVTIYAQPGMGIVGNRTKNIQMQGLRIVPLPGKKLSTNTDATHFTNCSGLIDFENCMFSRQGDDATNLHNFYYTMLPVSGEPDTAILKVKALTHALVLDAPKKGDTMEIVDYASMNVLTTMKVLEVKEDPKKYQATVKFDTALPNNLEKYAAINASRLPSLRMRGCHISSHRARGVLLKTRNVLVENCTIEECTLSAIHIGVEKGWGEGPGSENIVIRGNRFVNCGYGGECAGVLINCDGNESSRVHSGILIENNIIENESDRPDIIVSYAKGVLIRNNLLSKEQDRAVKIKNAEKVVVQD